MDEATARSTRRRTRGRRRLRIGSLALSSLMTMHCRLPASALTGGLFFFMVFLVGAVAGLANPVRHFEVYLGQWSISGPGRAFRIIPMLDGIGIAMCVNAIVRAITCCTTAAIAAAYVIDSVADAQLPFTYCRDFDLNTYTPEKVAISSLREGLRSTIGRNATEHKSVTIGLSLTHKAWRNASYTRRSRIYKFPSKVEVCKEKYAGTYPPMYTTPAYNYFYLEVVKFRNLEMSQFNVPLGVSIIVVWLVLWSFMIIEKLTYGSIIYNNIKPWLIVVPWIWSIMLVAQCASNLTLAQTLRRVFKLGNNKETVAALADAFEISLYIHSLSVGTELIHGKALHRYASGHIDPNLNSENVWHSGIVLMLAGLHTTGAAMCALVDYKHFNPKVDHDAMKEIAALGRGASASGATEPGAVTGEALKSTEMRAPQVVTFRLISILWIMPMYSKCTSMGNYSHLVSTLIFGGLMFSYLVVAFLLLKTVLHTIFEYRVKLVFREQFVVAVLIVCCMGLSLLYATKGGIALLESVDAIMTGIGMLFVVLMELICLLFVYRNHDFQSDMHVATEDNTCPTRIGTQWQIIPFLTLIALGMKLSVIPEAEMGPMYMGIGAIPLAVLVLAIPLRAIHNAYKFMKQKAPAT